MLRTVKALASLTALIVALGAAACNPPIYISGVETVNPELRQRSVKDLTRMFNRQEQVAKDIQVSATLWDLSWIVAFQEGRATRQEQSAEVARQNIDAWRKRFLVGQTSFRMRIELLNRAEVTAGSDRIVRFKEWSWKLKLSDGTVVPYKALHVELSRRWKAPNHRYHYRLDGTVHFGVRLDPEKVRWVELWAYPPGDRPAVHLRWNLKKP